MRQHPEERFILGQDTFEKEAQIRLDPFDQGRQDGQYDPDDPRYERHWFKRFWARLRGRLGRG